MTTTQDSNNTGVLQGKRICLVTSGSPGSNPRLVKEANALSEAGAEVMVIGIVTSTNRMLQERDASVMQDAAWDFRAVRATGLWGKTARRLRKLAGRVLYAAGLRTDRVCNLRLDPLTGSLAAKACDWPADLYIAHNLAALPAACQAARHHHALLGFDAEDFHSGQFAAHETGSVLARLTAAMERRYLPQCDYVTAASPGIASAYAAHCGIAMPTVILNVFPLSQAPPVHVSHHRQGDTPSLYWFSQTIGFGRGIETLAEAVCRAACQPVLYLQGSLQAGFLEALGKRIGADLLADRVRYLEPCLPDELIRRCAEFDAGIASELSSVEINRDIALTNKIFTYMLAGVAIIASDTSAQAALAQACGEAIQLYPQDDVQGLTRLLDDLFSTPDKLAHAREHAWQLGQQRYNWDQEQHVFLDVVQACLSGRKPV